MVPAFLAWLAASAVEGLLFLISYVTNHNAFPMPLSEKEEQKYLELMKNGEETARNVLIERNLRLVAHIVKKFDNTGEDMDDLISIGTIGLIKAINTFKQDKKTRLATYAARCIENEILMHLRTTRRMRTEVSLYDPIGVDKEGNELPLTLYRHTPKKPAITGAIADRASAKNHHRADVFLLYKSQIPEPISTFDFLTPGPVFFYTVRAISLLWE